MKFKIDKLLSAFGNKSAIESNYADSFTKNIINSINDEPYAISKENVMYAAVKELGGFFYFKTIIVGSFKIKTMKGATLLVSGNDIEQELKTDMDEFQSDYSNVSNCFITRIDFQIEEKEATILEAKNIKILTLKAKKHIIIFEMSH